MSCPGVVINGHCIPIYEVELKWPPKDPDPDPWRKVFDDIRILKTLDRGIANLADRRLRETLSDALHGAARAMPLPDGLKLGDSLFKGQKVMEAAE